jgi:hypothetical protein
VEGVLVFLPVLSGFDGAQGDDGRRRSTIRGGSFRLWPTKQYLSVACASRSSVAPSTHETGYCAMRGTGGNSEVHRGKVREMPEFMDVHTSMAGVTPEQLQEAHDADLAIQAEEQVTFKHAWADPQSGMVFCLSEAPNAEAVQKIHERAGHPADQVYAVPVQA